MQPFRFSCTSLSFPTLSLEGAAQVVAALGIANIDVCVSENERRVDIRRVLSGPEQAAQEDRAVCNRAGLGIVDVFCVLGRDRYDRPINTLDSEVRAENRGRMAAMIRYASALGASGLTILPGLEWPEQQDDGFHLSCEELVLYVRLAGDAGLRLSVEPHAGSIISTPAAAARMAEYVPGLSLTLDYSHFLASGFDQRDVHPLASHAGHFHARQAAPGRLQVKQREGALHFEEILGYLRRSGYRGAICIEYVYEPQRGLDNVDVVSETVLLHRHLQELVGSSVFCHQHLCCGDG